MKRQVEEKAMRKVYAEDERVISAFENPQNGSSPMWCYGTPVITRYGDRVFATVPETASDLAPTANTRLQLFCQKEENGEFEYRKEVGKISAWDLRRELDLANKLIKEYERKE